jgi:hypothetical protein
VLEKLGAYTAGTTSGIERRRVRAHLQTCASCTSVYAELRDVFSGLRSHGGLAAAPVVAAAGWQLGATMKGLFASTKFQAGLAATSAAAIGVLGFVLAPWGGGKSEPVDLSGKRAIEMHVDGHPVDPLTPIEAPVSSRDDYIERTEREGSRPAGTSPTTSTTPTTTTVDATADGARGDTVPLSSDSDVYDESAPVVYSETTVESYSQEYEDYTLVQETTTVTEVNSLDQTRTNTTSTTYKQPKESDPTALSDPEATPTT